MESELVAPTAGHASIGTILAGIIVFTAYLVWQATRGSATTGTTTVGDAFFLPVDVLAIYAAVCAARRGRSNDRLSQSWRFVAIAMVGYFIGHLIQGYEEVVRHVADSPDAADLVFYVFFFVALADFGARRSVVRRWMFALDTLTIALGGGAALWYFVAGPSATGLGDSIHEIVFSIAYPVADLVLLMAAVRALQRGVQKAALLPVRFLTVGILLYVMADTLVGHLNLRAHYQGGDRIDIFAMAATLCFVVAGALQSRTTTPAETAEARARLGSGLPYVAALSTFALLFVVQRHDRFFPDLSIAVIATLVAVVVATRQLVGQHALVDEQTKNEELMGELRHQAFHDALTGLPNRSLFYERLDHALARRRSLALQHAVLMIDLDGFKAVNDSFGHKAGDEMLQAVATRLSGAVRRGDTVARLGGDEFAILLEDVTDERAAIEIVEHLQRAIREPIRIGERAVTPEGSVGIALTDDEPHTPEDLLRFADAAMYQAKQRQTGYCVFESAMRAALADRVQLEGDLDGAVGRGELRVFYQPILDLSSERVIGFEALARWMHPTRGLLLPAAFIPLAEGLGLIHEVDTWVLHQACVAAASWHDGRTETADLSVHVNLSPLQLGESNLLASIEDALIAAGLEPRCLTLELLESSIVGDLDVARARLLELKSLGIRIAVDDFGTGYSSLNHLRVLPIDELKIDRSFIAGMESSVQASTLVNSLIQLGAALGIGTVAEGIETPEQLARLQGEECQQGQGYLFARPLEAAQVTDFLTDHARSGAHRF